MELVARNLHKRYASEAALGGVSFVAGPGVTAVLGPNGSGKTTLLRLLATATHPDAGELRLGDRNYADDLRRLRQVLGYLPQRLDVPVHLTPRRFLHYTARLKGVPAEPQASVLLGELGLGAAADRPVGELSGGQLRRVGIAQALLGSPRLLVLDEPTVGLDPEERERALALITRGAPERVVVMSCHVPGEVEEAQQVLVLRAGRIAFVGGVADLKWRATGHVCEVTVSAADVPAYLARYTISRVAVHGEWAVLRVVGEPPSGLLARPVAGSLEDAYLNMQGRLHTRYRERAYGRY